ncbi:HipA N-terminal domain-containing protein [Wenyingzhuangia sp. 2_MG-2023]|uniref:HipA N-terminal domain-containing protein n=1 Tax=Wenyingzhuangia sp. 2_MG-2023 TaxID=3062639 RepID=UPI0026E2D8CE|nr:HipA N-terminal domain-containing protein [Wenyingzhuangia sp. 2_MG-2023]MDO6737366.1 HipA N-terminal domain-containing protein [Wenyingzhuangia sp. 2_MG-2023]
MRQGEVWVHDQFAGLLTENEEGYVFCYDTDYLKNDSAKAVSLTLPLQSKPFESRYMFSFFDGLIPEGWLLEIAHKNWKLNPRDRMGLLLTTCRDCIGNISIIPVDL